MENLEIQVTQESGKICTNFETLEKELKLQMSAYENFIVVEDEISIAKGDLAFLRKLRTSIEDKRKAIKKEYLAPYNDFEDSCKKLTAIIDKPINIIDEQLKLFEADRIAKKHERITKLYIEKVGDYIRYLPVEKNYNSKWDNKSTTDQDIEFDISALLLKVKNDISVIDNLNSEIKEELLVAYEKSGNDLASAIQRNQQFLSDKEKVAEEAKRKAEEDAKRKAEEERLKAEEQITEPEKPVEDVKPFEQMKDLVQMTKTVCIRISKDDLAQVKELLDFSDINYTVEGE